MKKQTVSLLALLLAASGFFFSCGNTVNRNAYALEFDSIQVHEAVHLFGDTAKPNCNLTINFAFARQSSDVRLKDSLNSFFLFACFGDRYMTLTPEEAVKSYTERYVNDYRSDLEPMYRQEEEEDNIGNWYYYYKSIESNVQLCNSLLLTYRIDYNEYTGGAHGIYTTSFLNFDLRSLNVIRLDDLFEEDYQEALTDLLWKQLMADRKVGTRQELEEMGYGITGPLEPTENFYLSPKGINFYYNVYDIAPYSMGTTEITLSYEEIAPLMSSEFSTLSRTIKANDQ